MSSREVLHRNTTKLAEASTIVELSKVDEKDDKKDPWITSFVDENEEEVWGMAL